MERDVGWINDQFQGYITDNFVDFADAGLQQIVTEAYEQLLGYDSAADMANSSARIDYWVGRLESDLGRGDFVQEFLDRAASDQGKHVSDADFVGNKGAVTRLESLSEGASMDNIRNAATVGRDQAVEIDGGGQTFTLSELPFSLSVETNDPEVTWSVDGSGDRGVSPSQIINFLRETVDLDLVDLGVLSASGDVLVDGIDDINIDIENAQGQFVFNTSGDNDGDQTVRADVDIHYLDFVQTLLTGVVTDGDGGIDNTGTGLLFDADGNPRLSQDPFEEVVTGNYSGIVLTPDARTEGIKEEGYTEEGINNTIEVGRPELLHGAYIDGGAFSYNTLEVDMKGVFAQPFQLNNIQEIQVQNLPNVYGNFYAGASTEHEYSLDDNGNLVFDGGEPLDHLNFGDMPNWWGDNLDRGDTIEASVLDVSSAGQLERLVVTEGQFGSFPSLSSDGEELGELVVAGIRGSATAVLQGGFSEDVTLHYGDGLTGNGIDLELSNVDFNQGDLNIAHNANVLNIDSVGGVNHLNGINASNSGMLSHINVSGDALFHVSGDLGSIYHNGMVATFDASENTGGVNVNFVEQARVEFTGSQADDELEVINAQTVAVSNAAGENQYSLGASEEIVVTDGTGGNDYEINAGAIGSDTVVSLVANGGDNTAEFGDVRVLNVDFAEGNNIVEADGTVSETAEIELGGGDNMVFVDEANEVDATIADDAGTNTVDVAAESISVEVGGADNTVLLNGSYEIGVDQQPNPDQPVATEGFANGALLDVDFTGEGNQTLVLGHPEAGRSDGVTALEGSSISGDSIHMRVLEESDLTQANLSGVQSVEMNEKLTITAEQFTDLGAGAFSAYRADWGNQELLQVVVTEDTTLSELVDLSELSDSVKLELTVAKSAELTLSAEELHKHVAEGGIDLANVGDDLIGKVTITDAGLNFDAFDNGVRETDTGDNYGNGGTVTDAFDTSVNLTIETSLSGFERPGTDENTNTLVIDTDQDLDGAVTDNIELDDTDITLVQFVGDSDAVFDGAVLVPSNNLVMDFSDLNGNLEGLTIGEFERFTEDADPENWGQIIGNNSDTRIDVMLEGDVANADTGLNSSGVEQYMVVDADGADRAFWVSDSTQDITGLGVKGDLDAEITFGNVPWGMNKPAIILEGDGRGNYDEVLKEEGSPDASSISAVVADYFGEANDAPAVVNVNNGGVDTGETSTGEPRPIHAEGITVENARSLELNVEDGNAVIGNVSADGADEVVINGTGDVAAWVDGDSGAGDWASIDATGVGGTATIGLGEFNDSFDPTDFNGAGIEIDFSDASLNGVDAIALAADAELTLNQDQLDDIELVPAFDPDEDSASLHLVGLGEDEFSLGELPEGVDLASVTVAAEEEVTLHENTDLSGVEQLIVPEGTTLNLTAEQYNQLEDDDEKIVVQGDEDNHGMVNVTGFRQSDLFEDEDGEDVFDLSAVVADDAGVDDADVHGTISLADDDVTFGVRADDEHADLGGFGVLLGENQEVTFTDPSQPHERAVVGDGSGQVHFAFTELDGQDVEFNGGTQDGVNLSAFEGIDELTVWNALVEGENVEQILGLLSDDTVVNIIETPEEELAITHREVLIQEGVEVDGGLVFEDLRDAHVVETLSLTLLGDVDVQGILDISGDLSDQEGGFETLTINSQGGELNEMQDIQATDNNLLNVEVNAQQDLEVGGTLALTSEDQEDAVANLTVDTAEDVTVMIEEVTTSADIETLNITHNGAGELVMPGNSPGVALNADTEILNLSGDGDITLGDSEESEEGLDGGGELEVLNAENLSGDLDLGQVTGLSETDFAFTSGTGETSMVLTDVTLNSDVEEDETGWNLDFGSAAEDSVLEIGGGNTWTEGVLDIDLGDNTTLKITEDTDWSNLDLTLEQNQDIVLGEEVTLTLTAAQADGLNIVADPELEEEDLEDVHVNIVDLNEASTDLSGIQEELANWVRLEVDEDHPDPDFADVTLHEDTDLGDFTLELLGLGNDFGDGQTVRFQTEDQAARAIEVVDEQDPGTAGSNVVWLFNEVTAPVETSEYSGDLGRLWLNDELVDGQNVEDLYTSLEDSILRIEYTGELPELLGQVEGISRTVEVVAFTELEDGLIFSDEEDAPFVENLEIDLGGEVDLGDLTIDNVVGQDTVGDADFETLTIRSLRADENNLRLMPDDWDEEENAEPSDEVANVVGDIQSGAGHLLTEVVLETDSGNALGTEDGVALETGTITFDAELDDNGDPVDVTLTLRGDQDITVAAIDADDAAIDEVVINTDEFSGNASVPGTNPSLMLAGVETLEVTDTGNNTQSVDLGRVDFLEDEFSFSTQADNTRLELGSVALDDPDAEWSFTFDVNEGGELFFTNDVELSDGTINIDLGGEASIVTEDGSAVDFSDVDETITNQHAGDPDPTSFVIGENSTVTLDAMVAGGLDRGFDARWVDEDDEDLGHVEGATLNLNDLTGDVGLTLGDDVVRGNITLGEDIVTLNAAQTDLGDATFTFVIDEVEDELVVDGWDGFTIEVGADQQLNVDDLYELFGDTGANFFFDDGSEDGIEGVDADDLLFEVNQWLTSEGEDTVDLADGTDDALRTEIFGNSEGVVEEGGTLIWDNGPVSAPEVDTASIFFSENAGDYEADEVRIDFNADVEVDPGAIEETWFTFEVSTDGGDNWTEVNLGNAAFSQTDQVRLDLAQNILLENAAGEGELDITVDGVTTNGVAFEDIAFQVEFDENEAGAENFQGTETELAVESFVEIVEIGGVDETDFPA